MVVTKIEETSQAMISEEVRLRRASGRACIYYPEVDCRAPQFQFKICRTCPRCAQYVRKNVVRSVFEHIRSFAVSLLKGTDIQLPR